MAAFWQASGTLLGSTGADITPVIPTHQVDDMLILTTFSRVTTETCLTPSGWALIGEVTQGSVQRMYAFRRRSGGATPDPLCDWSATGGQKYGVVHTFRGVVTTGAGVVASAFTAGATSPVSATEVTTTADDQLVVSAGMSTDNTATAVSIAGTDPAALTQHSYATIITGADAGAWASSAVRVAAGATGTLTHTFTGTLLSGCMVVMALALDPVPPQIAMGRYNP